MDPATGYETKFISNGYAMRLGPPRLRQIRVTAGSIFFFNPESE